MNFIKTIIYLFLIIFCSYSYADYCKNMFSKFFGASSYKESNQSATVKVDNSIQQKKIERIEDDILFALGLQKGREGMDQYAQAYEGGLVLLPLSEFKTWLSAPQIKALGWETAFGSNFHTNLPNLPKSKQEQPTEQDQPVTAKVDSDIKNKKIAQIEDDILFALGLQKGRKGMDQYAQYYEGGLVSLSLSEFKTWLSKAQIAALGWEAAFGSNFHTNLANLPKSKQEEQPKKSAPDNAIDAELG